MVIIFEDLVLLVVDAHPLDLGVGVIDAGFLFIGDGLEAEGKVVYSHLDVGLNIFEVALGLDLEADSGFELDSEERDIDGDIGNVAVGNRDGILADDDEPVVCEVEFGVELGFAFSDNEGFLDGELLCLIHLDILVLVSVGLDLDNLRVVVGVIQGLVE